jgi:hypothetical protein
MDHTDLNIDNYDGRFTWRCGAAGSKPIVYDVEGAGGTPNGRNIRYLGALVLVSPDTFLRAAMALEAPRDKTVGYLPSVIHDQGIAPPMLYLREIKPVVLKSGGEVGFAVSGHEGRHRARLVEKLGCRRMPVQIIIDGYRARHIDKAVLDVLEAGVVEERVRGREHLYDLSWMPFPFIVAFVNGERFVHQR